MFSIELDSSRPIWKDLVTLGPDLKGLLPSISGLPALTLGSFSICWPSLVAVFPGKSFLKWHWTRRFWCSFPVTLEFFMCHPVSPLSPRLGCMRGGRFCCICSKARETAWKRSLLFQCLLPEKGVCFSAVVLKVEHTWENTWGVEETHELPGPAPESYTGLKWGQNVLK